jgi:hypothetical protein
MKYGLFIHMFIKKHLPEFPFLQNRKKKKQLKVFESSIIIDSTNKDKVTTI